MKARVFLPAICAALFICMLACAAREPQVVNKPATPDNVSVIALLPVACAPKDAEISRILKDKLLKELHFKGYPPVAAFQGNAVTSRTDRNQSMPDAAMQCSILENTASKRLFYAPVTVSLACELRSTETGEILWAARHRATCRSFDLFRDRLDMKTRGSLESVLEETVAKVLESLPYGPQLRG
jgi:hypothetical protein